MKNVLAILLVVIVVIVLIGGLGSAQQVGAVENPYAYEISEQEKNEYYAAITNCETPSLECLVRYTTRFVAIEWVNDIAGPNITKISGEYPTGASAPTGGAIGGLFNLMTAMYEYPAASTHTYVADVVNNAGFASPAYAQGLGFASLEPILELWKTFRNVAYFFFILFFIVIGLMIMFRFKIGGQTAVTAQQAIPSVIISLILVTFSYAIAGFMIDLMYVVMFMIVTIFAGVGRPGLPEIATITNMNIFQLGGTLFSATWGNLPETSSMIASIITAITESQSNALSDFVGMIGGITLSLVISIAVLIGVFKLFFELLKAYFIIVVSIVTAPVILMFGALPGRNVFFPWLKNIVGNLAAFPAVLLVVVLFYQLTATETSSGGFMPPFLFGSGQAGIIGPVMGLAIILALPELVKKIKEVFGAGDGGFGSVIGAAAMGGLKEGWGGRGWMPGAGAVFSGPRNALSLAGIGAETGFEKSLLGNREFRRRQHEIALLTKDNARPHIAEKGGLLGWWERNSKQKISQQEQVRREAAQRHEAKEKLAKNKTSNTAADVDKYT